MNSLQKVCYSITLASFLMLPTAQAVEEKTKICVEVKDAKGVPVKDEKGNVKQSCKVMKVHKKLEGKEVPPKK
jgi:hypothetical protein